MIRVVFPLFLAALACAPARAGLDEDLRAILRDPLLRNVQTGVEVIALGDTPEQSRVIFQHNADSPLMPASNMKLVTTASAIEQLGGDFRFRTVLLRHGDDLILLGDGDPTFGDAELLRKAGWDITTVFERWAAELKKAGVAYVANVLVDDSVFDTQFVHPRWDPKQLQSSFSAQVAGMTLNRGMIELKVRAAANGQAICHAVPPTKYVSVLDRAASGPSRAWATRELGGNQITLRGTLGQAEQSLAVTVHDPALYAGTVLSETLARGGVKVTGRVARQQGGRTKADAPGYTVVAIHETPLIRALERANKDSVNNAAEALCKRVGFAASGAGSWDSGAAASSAFLRKIGAGEKEFALDDGCGLSRQNRLSANTLATVLRHVYLSKQRELFIGTLAVGGQDGTLDNRFKNDLRGRVHAKTGFISGVSALSGYVKTRGGKTFAFSILMNDVPEGKTWRARELQDAMVKAIDAL